MQKDEERVWVYIVRTRSNDARHIATHCGVPLALAESCLSRIASDNWQEPVRSRHVGESDYSTRTIQPWDIWLEYGLNPWDADIIKRVLRRKPGSRRQEYEKIIHVCEERIRQLDEESEHAGLAPEESPDNQIS